MSFLLGAEGEVMEKAGGGGPCEDAGMVRAQRICDQKASVAGA